MDRDELLRCLPSNRELFYGGRWHSPISGLYEQTIDPATGASLGDVAEGGTSDVAAAVSAAHAGFLVWPSRPQAAILAKSENVLGTWHSVLTMEIIEEDSSLHHREWVDGSEYSGRGFDRTMEPELCRY